MSKVLVSESSLSGIANSIRAKNGTQQTYLPSEMSTAIDNLPSGGGGSDIDWSQIGYSNPPKMVAESYNYAKQIYNNWNVSTISMANMFENDKQLYFAPLLDTSNVENMNYAFASSGLIDAPPIDTSKAIKARSLFYSCYGLVYVPIYNFESITGGDSNFKLLYQNCSNLTDESLNNILASLLSVTSNFTGTKTLKNMGLSSTQATTCTGLSNWSLCTAKGWTTGY